MFCPKCGKESPANDAFCSKCGHGLKGQRPSSTASSGSEITVKNPKVGKNKQLVGLGILAVGVIIFLVGISTLNTSENLSAFGLTVGTLVFLAGLVVNIIGRFEHWYHAE